MTRNRTLLRAQANLGRACLMAASLATALAASLAVPVVASAQSQAMPRYTVSTLTDAISLDTQSPLPLWEEVPWIDSQDRVLGLRKQYNPVGAFFGALAGFGDGMATLARPASWAPVAAGSPAASVKPTNLSGTGTSSELMAISPDGQWWVVYERGLTPAFKVIHGSVSVRVQPGSGYRVFLGAVNNQGVAGGCLEQTSTGVRTPVLWRQGSFTRLATGAWPGGMVHSVNEAGDAAGKLTQTDGYGQQVARWIGGQLQVMPASLASAGRAEHINARGTVAVVYALAEDAQVGRIGLWRQDQLTELTGMRTLAGLNNLDEVLGQSTEGAARAAVWRDGQVIDLTRELQAQGVLPATARAYLGRSINDRGSVVLDVSDNGQYTTVRASGQRP